MKKIYKIIMNNWLIVIVMIISLVLHILAIKQLEFNYSLNSDDASSLVKHLVSLEFAHITLKTFLLSFLLKLT